MKVSQLVAVLKAAASLYDECGNTSRSEALRALSLLCTGQESKGVAPFVAAVEKALTRPAEIAECEDRSGVGASIKIAELVGALEHVYQLFVLIGTKAAIGDLRKFIDLLKNHVDDDAVNFVRRSQKCLISAKGGRSAGPPPSYKSASVPTLETIDRYVEDLKRAGTDRIEFDHVFSGVKRDKDLKKADLIEIAHRYSGVVIKYKTKDEAKAEIESAFVRNARFISKLQ
jgi:hypothetical protein